MKNLVHICIFASILLISCTAILTEPVADQVTEPVSVTVPVPATPTLQPLLCPTPTVVYIRASAESPTSSLTPSVFVGLAQSDAITITGKLGVYTGDGSGPIQVELIPDTLNLFRVEGHVARIDLGHGCVLGDFNVHLSRTLWIKHVSDPTPTP